MLRVGDFNEFCSLKRVFVDGKIEKLKLNNFLTRVDLKIMAEDDCLVFLDDSFLGLWGEGVLFTKNYLVYNLLGECGHIPLCSISTIEFVGSDVVINASLALTFRKIPLGLVFDVFRVVYASLKRNDASLIDVRNHVGGRGILSNISLKDEVVGFFLFVKANQNKEKIVALIGEHHFKDKEHIREFIVHDDNLKALSSALVGCSGLEGDVLAKTTDFFYMAFKYYSSFFYDELNYYKEDLARAEARELELQRKEDLARSKAKAEADAAARASRVCSFVNVFAVKGEPASEFMDAFLSVVNGYSRKYQMNESAYWFVFTAHLDFYLYTLATRKLLQASGLNQVFLAPFVFLLEGNKDRMQELSGLMNDEVVKDALVSMFILMANQKAGNKEGNFNFLYEKILLCEEDISEGEFMQGLNVVKKITERLVVEVLRPEMERSAGIDNLF